MLRPTIYEAPKRQGRVAIDWTELREKLTRLGAGTEMIIHAKAERDLDRTITKLVEIARETGATLAFPQREERVAMKPRLGAKGLWRESRGFYAYALKRAQYMPFSGATFKEVEGC